jgi:hypothetical protein
MKLKSKSSFIISLLMISSLVGCSDRKNENKNPSSPIDTTKFYSPFSKDSLEDIYNTTLSFLWKTYVPKSGQAETEQGELVRIIEKLDDEIAGNAKANWDTQFVLLAHGLRDTLIRSGIFSQEIRNEIYDDIDILSRSENEVYTDSYYYDRLRRRIVEWYWRNKKPVKHTFNPGLER